MDTTILTAVISSVVATLGIIVSIILSSLQNNNQYRIHSEEIALKTKELESQLEKETKSFEIVTRQLQQEYEELKQAQYTEVLKKRLETYPLLWKILAEYMINWKVEGKARNADWAIKLLHEINACSAEIGIYFSEGLYRHYAEFRNILVNIKNKNEKGEDLDQAELTKLDEIYFRGIAIKLKDDLGSYGAPAIQVIDTDET